MAMSLSIIAGVAVVLVVVTVVVVVGAVAGVARVPCPRDIAGFAVCYWEGVSKVRLSLGMRLHERLHSPDQGKGTVQVDVQVLV